MKRFKFEIIRQGPIEIRERFLPYFLGETREEANKLYGAFSELINIISYNYAIATGLDKTDIFGEAVIGLARARRDFDPDKGLSFRNYVIFRVKDAINSFVRSSGSVISVPTYLMKASAYVSRMREGCKEARILFERAAERAGISSEMLSKRVELIPSDVEYEDLPDDRNEDAMYVAILVEQLKKYMTEDELAISEMIMKGKTFREIADAFGKTGPWVVYKLKKLRERLVKEIDIEEVKTIADN